MKRNRILITATMIFVMAITSFGQTSSSTAIKPAPIVTPAPVAKGKPGLGRILVQKAQEAQADALTAIPTASQVLANIMDEINSGKVPAAIYPPGLLDNLKKMGNQPIRTAESFNPADYALKPGDKANMSWLDATFLMGSPTTEMERNSNEAQYTPIISYAFYIGNYEVTQNEYQQVVGSNPSWFTSANGFTDDLNRPVENVTWAQAVNYCSLLTTQERANGHISSTWAYRLPTETEWEYSCRGGRLSSSHVITSQSDDSTALHSLYYYGQYIQGLGTGLSGNFGSFTVHVNAGGVSSTIYGRLLDLGTSPCTDPGYNGSCGGVSGWYSANTTVSGTTMSTVTFDFTHNNSGDPQTITLDPTHYYYVSFGIGVGNSFYIYGCNSDCFGGDGYATSRYLANGPAIEGHQVDAFFSANDVGGVNGMLTAFNFGSGIHGGYANFDDHYEYDAGVGSINITTPTIPQLNITAVVGSYDANGLGLYDMHGNSAEWCQDYYGTYPSGTKVEA
ncbi:MAG: SUMF1/EgtB/PvdO family nonheme iron enzyme [Candidatus Nomurabacteria bacterium]|nr:SUMF1/EgtB/PvdO family nonheme iron enzyme [Candidatus Nomurabacteria bacterium]